MFENVSNRLTDYLRGAASDFDRESFYYFSAAYLALFYLGKNFTDPTTSDFLVYCPLNNDTDVRMFDKVCHAQHRFDDQVAAG